jgi:hypothetical protein
MKTWHVVALSAVLGIVVGFGIAVARIQLAPWDGTPAGVKALHSLPGRDTRLDASHRPKVAVDREVFDYGVMDSQVDGKHVFLVSNIGSAPLTLTEGVRSCKCTKFEIAKTALQPGETTKVTMEWTAKSIDGPSRNSVTIKTNDPEKRVVDLVVTGRVTTAIKVLPPELDITRVQAGQPAAAQVRLLGYLPEGFRILQQDFSDPKTAEYFDAKIERMTAAQMAALKEPGPGDLPGSEKVVKCAYVVDVTVKPGLPVGAFRQILRLKTDAKTVPAISIAVRGLIVSEDVVVLGAGVQAGVLDIDVVSPEKETSRRLILLAQGPHYKQLNFQLLEVIPDVLKVEIGKTVPLSGKSGTQTPLVIRIPMDSRPVNCLGSPDTPMGRVRLKTNHPDPKAGELEIRVRFAVEG